MSGANSTFTSPVEILGTKKYLFSEGQLTPGELQEIVNFTTVTGKLNRIYSVSMDCSADGRCRIIHTNSMSDETLVGSFRTGPAKPFEQYVFLLPFDVAEDESFRVDFEAVEDSPEIDIAGFVQLTERDK